MNIYQFMNDSPVLTFFLFMIAAITITEIAKYIVIAIRGYEYEYKDDDNES